MLQGVPLALGSTTMLPAKPRTAFAPYTAQTSNTSLAPKTRVRHHFTIDVEEYFQVSALEPYVQRSKWDSLESRVEHSMARLLSIMDENGVQATCFVLGWIAERHPQMVRSLADAGHEIASHGTDHRRVTHQSPDEFRESVRRSKQVLEDLIGRPVRGFRAPSFSIVIGREWALDILVEEGYEYDSSLFPIWRPDAYGYAGAEPDPHWLVRPAGRVLEMPPMTMSVFGTRLPAGGGAYFRILPTALIHSALQECERRGVPGTFYIHPWELDAAQPRLATSVLTRLRHYSGLSRTSERLRALMRQFRFQTMAASLSALYADERRDTRALLTEMGPERSRELPNIA